jgi:hypothetical protein
VTDNTVLNAGSGGDTIATDDVAGVKYQIVKLADGTADATTVVKADNGVAANALRVTIASDSTGVIGVTDNGGSLTVDGTVTAAGGAAHDAVVSGNPNLVAAYASAAAPTDVSTDGDAVRLWALKNGSQVVNIAAAGALIGATSNALDVNIKSGSAGTTQYTEDGASAGAESLVLAGAVRRDTAASSSTTDGDYSTINTDSSGRLWVNASGAAVPITDNAGSLTVDGTVAVSGTVTVDSELTTADLDTGAGTDTRAVVGLVLAASGGALLVGSANPIPVSDNSGSLTVDNGGTFAVQATVAAAATNIAKAEDVASADADVGVPAMAVRKATPANTSNADGDYEFIQMSAGRLWVDPSGVTLTVASHAVTNAGTFAVQESGTQVQADDAAFTPATSKIVMAGFEADETATDSVDEGDGGAARMTLDRKIIVTPYAHAAAGGATPFYNLDVDESEDAIKASAGKLMSLIAINRSTGVRYLKLYNDTTANITVGSSTPVMVIPLPTTGGTLGAGMALPIPSCGIQFSAAITIAATTGFADNDSGAPGTNDVIVSGAYI